MNELDKNLYIVPKIVNRCRVTQNYLSVYRIKLNRHMTVFFSFYITTNSLSKHEQEDNIHMYYKQIAKLSSRRYAQNILVLHLSGVFD
jgi:hypothetical protein